MGAFLLEGPHVVAEAVSAGIALTRMFVLEDDSVGIALAERARVHVTTVTDAVLARISTTTTPQSPVAIADIPRPVIPPEGDLLVAWGVSDPGNAGTLIRSAAAFGMGYVTGPGTADSWAPKVVRSAAGAHFHTSVGNVAELDQLRVGGRLVAVAVGTGGELPAPQTESIAVLVGNEAHGLDATVVAAADLVFTIPMSGRTESLNAGVAGSIIAYALSVGKGSGSSPG